MTGAWRHVPRAGGGTALLLLVLGLVVVSAWPERADLANTSWYPATAVRATFLAGWAWALGWANAVSAPASRVEDLLRPALGAVVTAPLEALAHVAGAPTEPLTWSLVAPLLLAWALYGGAWGIATIVRRLRTGALTAPLAVLLGVGLIFADGRLGLGWFTPWVLPRAPDPVTAAALGAMAAVTWTVALRGTRRGTPE